jgi:hypothetical protein
MIFYVKNNLVTLKTAHKGLVLKNNILKVTLKFLSIDVLFGIVPFVQRHQKEYQSTDIYTL